MCPLTCQADLSDSVTDAAQMFVDAQVFQICCGKIGLLAAFCRPVTDDNIFTKSYIIMYVNE